MLYEDRVGVLGILVIYVQYQDRDSVRYQDGKGAAGFLPPPLLAEGGLVLFGQ